MDTIIAGLQFGDEGKGSIVDYLADENSLIVRYNGGSQAAHHVVTPQDITHCFAQFGSGTFRKGSITYLSPFMLVDPLAILAENDVLKQHGVEDALSRLYIDNLCPVITPFNRILNQMQETASNHEKGSCGAGVGETVKDLKWLGKTALHVGDFLYPEVLRSKLDFLWRLKIDIAEQVADQHPGNERLQSLLNDLKMPDFVDRLSKKYQRFAKESGVHIITSPPQDWSKRNIIFEGAQGTLLDPEFGFTPYVTQTKTTFKNADLLQNNFRGKAKHLGILRAYTTRHGPGPFPTETPLMEMLITEIHNSDNDWQRHFRYGWFDLVLAKYAKSVLKDGIDSLAITNVDRLNYFHTVKVCTSYIYINPPENLEEYFTCQRKDGYAEITSIKVPTKHNLKHQLELTELLFRCRPVYQDFPGWKSVNDENLNRYLEFLQRELETPIEIVSFGQTRNDKKRLQTK